MTIPEMRKQYRAVREALPWLDAWHRLETQPFDSAHGLTLPSADLPEAGSCPVPDPDGRPVILKASDFTPAQAEEMLRKYPRQNFIYATSSRKLIYDRSTLIRLCADYPNFYICCANFTPCMLVLEEFYGRGLTGKLVYGSGLPDLRPFWIYLSTIAYAA